ncbi:hypothetical protein PVAG01_11327 [Phlyctema vagabunda]|uniref:Uncharacterized protein n=1 Tax=Phlyctema vagabunda TaxID=108571 RepID=A0ABR4P203_9HELO
MDPSLHRAPATVITTTATAPDVKADVVVTILTDRVTTTAPTVRLAAPASVETTTMIHMDPVAVLALDNLTTSRLATPAPVVTATILAIPMDRRLETLARADMATTPVTLMAQRLVPLVALVTETIQATLMAQATARLATTRVILMDQRPEHPATATIQATPMDPATATLVMTATLPATPAPEATVTTITTPLPRRVTLLPASC